MTHVIWDIYISSTAVQQTKVPPFYVTYVCFSAEKLYWAIYRENWQTPTAFFSTISIPATCLPEIFFSELPMSQIDKIKMFSRQGKIKLHQRNPKATITTAFNLSFFFFLHFTHNMKHLQLCFGQSDFHLPEVGLIIPNRSRLLGLTSSNREWWGTDLRKPSPQATHSPAHHWYQKGSITLIPRPHTPGRKWTCNENTPHYQRLPLNSGERVGHSRLI